MGTFLDHLQDAAMQQRTLQTRERREHAEILADYTKRSKARGQQSIRRSTPQPVTLDPSGS